MIEYYDKEELELQISNYLSGNSTDEEKETLLAFLASNEAAARTFREMSAVWALSSVPSFAEIENSNLVRIKERMTAPASSKPVRKLIPVWLKVAGYRRYSADRLQLFLVYVYGKSDGSIYQRRFSLRNQGSCRIKNEYRSS